MFVAIDYAVKYEREISERFKNQSFTDSAVNGDYDFVGVRTVKVYSVPTVAMNDYRLTGQNRYGNPDELENSAEELAIKNDRSFTFIIDRRNSMETQGAMDAGAALARQIDEVVVPEIDRYRLEVMAENAGCVVVEDIDETTAYSAILDASLKMTEESCPTDNRVAFVGPNFYKNLKLDNSFIKNTEIAQTMLVTGQVGLVDNIKIILMPSSYLPEGVEAVIAHNSAVCAAQKLQEYKIHDNPPGINGWLVEGRVCYDAFVLANRKGGIAVIKNSQA